MPSDFQKFIKKFHPVFMLKSGREREKEREKRKIEKKERESRKIGEIGEIRQIRKEKESGRTAAALSVLLPY